MLEMDRRQCLGGIGAMTSAACCPRGLAGDEPPLPSPKGAKTKPPAVHLPGRLVSPNHTPVPPGKRVPFGWPSVTVGDDAENPVQFVWPKAAGLAADTPAGLPTSLRVTVALDVRDAKRIDVTLAGDQQLVGQFDIRYPSPLQVFEIPLLPRQAAGVIDQGIRLTVRTGSDLRIFLAGDDVPAVLSPHLMIPGSRSVIDEYYDRMDSLATIQPYGWMEGCVLDGLLDLSTLPGLGHLRQTAQRHLDQYIIEDSLVYESIRSQPSDRRVYGIEGTLPFAALARLDPESPVLQAAVDFWTARRRPSDGSIQDGEQLSSEGAYTVGYPMAVVAASRGDQRMIDWALHQVSHRYEVLFTGTDFWRTRNDGGRRGNKNWARGTAWQLLGMARTMAVLADHRSVDGLVGSLRKLADFVIGLQRPDGLWSVFADQPEVPPETGGSAGLAAGLAIGARRGWLDESAMAAAGATRSALEAHLTPDGMLGGVAQANKGGESLQRGDYRVIYQIGMGLMGQLIAALDA